MPSSYYESERILSEYLLFHYGSVDKILPWSFGPSESVGFPIRVVRTMLEGLALPPGIRALDLGCAVGRSSFELARYADEVIGIDRSSAFIAAAKELQTTGSYRCNFITEGDLTTDFIAQVPNDIDRNRLKFEVGDALELPKDYDNRFDLLLAANLIDRLPTPIRLIKRLPNLITPGGHLILASPYTWLEEFTPKEQWIGGYRYKNEPKATSSQLKSLLSKDFELIRREDLPFLIREHRRKFQWSVAETTLWRHRI